MTDDWNKLPRVETRPRYRWPWWVLGAVLLGIALAILWMSQEIGRARRIRELNAPAPQTNQAAPHGDGT
jgi:hypothetical protein